MVNRRAAAADTLGTVTEESSIAGGTTTETAETATALRAATVLFLVGIVTLAVLTFFLDAWINVHVRVWRAGPGCNPFGAANIVRGLTTLVAAAGVVGIAVSGLWLGIRPVNRNARRLFWSAIVSAWVAVGGFWLFGLDVFIDCALVE
jgi:hypothetical protein